MQAETPHPQRCDALCLADVTWLKFARGEILQSPSGKLT